MLDFLYLKSFDEGKHRRRPTGRHLASLQRSQVAPYLFALAVLSVGMSAQAENPLPTGFNADRYRSLWERNPFTLVTPATPGQSQTFSKLVVVSWMNDGGKDSLFVQDSDTNDVQMVTD